MNFENFFHLFNIKPAVFIDHQQLDKQYQHYQKLIHPDQQNDDLNELAALNLATKITKAYDTLKNPLSCVDHMLMVCNIPSLKESSQNIHDIDLLEEMMSLEELYENNPSTILQQMQKIKNLLNENVTFIEKAFKEKNNSVLQKNALFFFYRFKFLQKIKSQNLYNEK